MIYIYLPILYFPLDLVSLGTESISGSFSKPYIFKHVVNAQQVNISEYLFIIIYVHFRGANIKQDTVELKLEKYCISLPKLKRW